MKAQGCLVVAGGADTEAFSERLCSVAGADCPDEVSITLLTSARCNSIVSGLESKLFTADVKLSSFRSIS